MTFARRLQPSLQQLALPTLGLLLVLGLWWLAVHGLGRDSLMASRFSPENTWMAVRELAAGADIWRHALYSLRRVGLGLLIGLYAV